MGKEIPSKFEFVAWSSLQLVEDLTLSVSDCHVDKVITYFELMVQKHFKVPSDKPFSTILSAFNKGKKFEYAENVFNEMHKCLPVDIKQKVLGAWSYTAMFQTFRFKIQNSDQQQKDLIITKVGRLLEDYKIQKIKFDHFTVAEILSFYASIGHYEKVIDIFTELNSQIELDIVVYGKYVAALLQVGRVDEVYAELNFLKELYARAKALNKHSETIVRVVYEHLVERYVDVDQEKAESLCKEAIGMGLYSDIFSLVAFTEPSSYIRIGWDFYYHHRYGSAILAYQAAVRLIRDNISQYRITLSDAYQKMGLAFYSQYFKSKKLEHFNQALESYKHAIWLDTENVEAIYNLGVAFEFAGKYSEAIEQFQALKEKGTSDASVFYYLGSCCWAQSDFTSACENYQESVKKALAVDDKLQAAQSSYKLGCMQFSQYVKRPSDKLFCEAKQALEHCLIIDVHHLRAYQKLVDLKKMQQKQVTTRVPVSNFYKPIQHDLKAKKRKSTTKQKDMPEHEKVYRPKPHQPQ